MWEIIAASDLMLNYDTNSLFSLTHCSMHVMVAIVSTAMDQLVKKEKKS